MLDKDKKEDLRKRVEALQERLKESLPIALDESGVSPGTIAQECGVTEQAVNGWKKTGKIEFANLLVVSRLTGWSINKMVGEPEQQRLMAANDEIAPLNEIEIKLLDSFRELLEGEKAELIATVERNAVEARKRTEEILRRHGVKNTEPHNAKNIPLAPIETDSYKGGDRRKDASPYRGKEKRTRTEITSEGRVPPKSKQQPDKDQK